MSGPKNIQTKPKHTRASGPKVRTGCLTCKVRHVKCDEAKPICKRCQDHQVTCDGYLPPKKMQLVQKRPRKMHAHSKNDADPILPLPRACLNPDSLRDHSWTVFFHHFRTSTVTDLALPPYSTSFWDRHVLPLCNAIPAVRFAATALGVAHRAFLLESPDRSTQEAKQQLEDIAVHQYNNAISQLLRHASAGGPMDVRITITCSLLFYCLENMRGHSDESIQHLRAGSKLILSLPPHPSTETGESGTNRKDPIGEIASLFARVGVEASLYSEDEIVPDLRSHMTPASNALDDPSQPFRDFNDARDSFFNIYIDLGTCTNRSFVLVRNGYRDQLLAGELPYLLHLADKLDPSTTDPSTTLFHGPSYANGLDTGPVIVRFRSWSRRFKKTVAEAEKRGTTKRERQEIAMLELRRRVWDTMLDEVPDGDAEHAESILNQAELVLQSFSSSHPIFTLESNVIPSVSFICFYSNDERNRRRALDILRSAHMREGVWDSSSLFSTIEPQFPELQLPSTVVPMSSQNLGRCMSDIIDKPQVSGVL